MKKLILLTAVILGIFIQVNAQQKSRKEIKGDKYSFIYAYDKAIEWYTHVKNLTVEGQRNLADCYYKIDENVLSEKAYADLITPGVGIKSEDYYNYAMVLKSNGKYQDAANWMDKFSIMMPDDLRVASYQANKTKMSTLLQGDGRYLTKHLNVNTDALDFGTTYYQDKIVFSSTRQTAKFVIRKFNWTRRPFWDMYVSEVSDGELKRPKVFDKRLNGKMHDGPASFSNNDQFMAFTRNNYATRILDKVVELEIWFSAKNGEKWSKPTPFQYNSKEYSVGHPCLSADGNTMYFSSDMPGGYGKADIYRTSRLGNGSWSTPENLGSTINTEGDEMFPFFEKNSDLLYFSSNGHYGMGGLDIYSCLKDGAGFGEVYNSGSPLNTQFDDFAAILDKNMTNGYFTSTRTNGKGGEDLYSFDRLQEPPSDIDLQFSVYAPENIPVERSVRETFPLRNYIFFNIGSTEIPDRYVLLNKNQVKDFKEDQLEVFTPKYNSGRSNRQMVVYYNILNILGDRMQKNPSATIVLIGASELGPEDGLKMAESVRQYLVEIFSIDINRIALEGRDKPKIPAEQPGETTELILRREGDRRVSIESSSPSLIMEFQSGPDAPLRPVEFTTNQEAPVESYVTFTVAGETDNMTSWSMVLTDNNGKAKSFGPYYQNYVCIPGKSILGATADAVYKVSMTSYFMDGTTVSKDTSVHMVLWTPPKEEALLRFSIIYEFNNSSAIAMYEKYLTEVIVPKIPIGSTVAIHGYTDIIGDKAYNLTLSAQRANDVKGIIENGLQLTGRKDVKFMVYGLGEDQALSPFANQYPEERFYNRTVIIDIIPPSISLMNH
jgi:outer membrane protein OmpA-like peptidoglycan-associated protein